MRKALTLHHRVNNRNTPALHAAGLSVLTPCLFSIGGLRRSLPLGFLLKQMGQDISFLYGEFAGSPVYLDYSLGCGGFDRELPGSFGDGLRLPNNEFYEFFSLLDQKEGTWSEI